MKRITLTHNDNNKLHCQSFVHVVPADGSFYPQTEGYEIWLKQQYMGEAKLVAAQQIPVQKITMSLAHVACGYKPEVLLAKTFKKKIHGEVNPEAQVLVLCFHYLHKAKP